MELGEQVEEEEKTDELIFEEEEKTELIFEECRICLEEDLLGNLISPCICKGTNMYVHARCLAQWRRRFSRMHIHRHYCSVCKTNYTTPISGYIVNEHIEEHRIDIPPERPRRTVRQQSVAIRQRRRMNNATILLHVSFYTAGCINLFSFFIVMLSRDSPYSSFILTPATNPFTLGNIWFIVHLCQLILQSCFTSYYTNDLLHILSFSGLGIYAIYFTPFMLAIINIILLVLNMAYLFEKISR